MALTGVWWRAGLSLIALLALVGGCSAVTIMSIDFGSEWMKVAVVAPGVPMEIALNRESKRKTPLAIAFRNGERTFGEDALTNGIRFPHTNFFYLLDLLGKKVDNPIVKLYQSRFPFYNIEADPGRDTASTGLLKINLQMVFCNGILRDTTYTVEELVAQLLEYARDIAVAHTDQRIKDCVITVPAFFNQAERRALLTAADLAGLKASVLSLMSSNAAVALDYGMFRRKEINGTAQNILFYDMGASSTSATIVSYQTIKTKEKGYSETNPQVTVLGLGYDRSLGGLEMQLRLRDYLAKKFNEVKKTTNDVFKSPRGMAKLLKESGRLAKVLSANSDHLSQVEGVLDEEDFKLMVTREDFEGLCADVFERVRAPVDGALISAGMDISAIDQFIIVGGATRVPRIQAILQDVWGKELGKNINADEAAAMGAVYRAADLGQGFKVKKFHVKEGIVFPVEVDFERYIENEDGSTNTKVVKRSLFALGNNYPQKKVMTFNKHTTDFNFCVNYAENEHLPKAELLAAKVENISHVLVSGVTSAYFKHQKEGNEPKGIKAHFNMDDSGVLTLAAMEAVFEKSVLVEEDKPEEEESTLSKLGSTISKLFSGSEDEKKEEGKENKTEESEAEKDGEKKEGGKKEDKTAEKKDGSGDKKTDKKPDEDKEKTGDDDGKTKKGGKELKPKQVTVKEELNFTLTYLDVSNMTPERLQQSRKKLEDIGAAERTRHEKEASRNTLESYILDAQDKLWQKEYEAASTDEQRVVIREMCSTLDEWIYDEGFDQAATVYKEKLGELSKLFEPIKERVQEHRDRPEAIQARNRTVLMYISLSFVCAFCLLCTHFIKKWKRSTETRLSCDKGEGSWGSVVEKIYSLGHLVLAYLSIVGYLYKGKGRTLKDDKGVSPNTSKGNGKNQQYSRLALQDMINGSSMFLQRAREAPLEHQLFTDTELTTMDTLIVDVQKWLEDKEELQDKTALSENPKLTLSDIGEKWSALDREKRAKRSEKRKGKKREKEEKEAEKEAPAAEKEEETNVPETEQREEEKRREGGDTRRQEEKDATDSDIDEAQVEETLDIFEDKPQENNSEGDRRKDTEEEEAEEPTLEFGGEDDKTHTEL
ncbi:Hypoxia up-regulated protein 1-like [Homarus americanus]|uniref:Hypoxia up-regulated protein 1 n=1 Tax=Homarus americanus TaxID=6706 RepID=A0A8J5NBN2_HOMAM|nr:Hypoxia up-regulated protein 1-like [Homarus americanus]